MIKRRGTARQAADLRKQMGIFEPGDTVTSVLAGSIDFIGSVTRVDSKIAKVFVNWGDGTEMQCSPDEIQLLPYAAGVNLADRFSRISRRGRLSEDIPSGDQFVGDPKTHGIDKPRGGGFSIMQNLQKDLAPESKEEAKDGPFTASLKTAGKVDRVSNAIANFLVGDRKAALAQLRSMMNLKLESKGASQAELADKLSTILKQRVASVEDEGRRMRASSVIETIVTKWEDDGTVAESRETKWDGEDAIPVMASRRGSMEGKQGSDFSRERWAASATSLELYTDFRDGGNKPEEAAERVLDIVTSGMWAVMDGDKIKRAIKTIIREFERKYKRASTEEPKSRRALYWGGPGRVYRQTRGEQEQGTCSCPKCKGDMEKQPFTKSEKLHACPGCGFKVPSGSLTTKKIEIEIEPDGEVEIEVTAGRRGRLNKMAA